MVPATMIDGAKQRLEIVPGRVGGVVQGISFVSVCRQQAVVFGKGDK